MEKVGNVEVKFCQGTSSKDHKLYPGFKPEAKVLRKGLVIREEALALPCDILWERDVPVKLRDGVTIYTDIYRPPNAQFLLPAVVSSGPFGKNGGLNRHAFDSAPWRNGVPQCTVSALEKFEGLDPAYWCLHGYALVHSDMRGTWMSEGDTYINSTLDGRDGYDLIEWIAGRPWSNKRVAMAGNSYLSQTQWFVGAEKPPHLACLAPWEGWNDLYNDSAMRGGIPNPEFQQAILTVCSPGLARTEDVTAMTKEYPLWNEYWDDRRARCDKIEVPIYVVASWTNALHTKGTLRGFIESSSKEKWLRVHNSHEWPDLYYSQNTEDLRKFFDYYMKDIKNDWIFTPKARLSILNPGGTDIINRPEETFPLTRQISIRLYLDSRNASMTWDRELELPSQIKIDAWTGVAKFTYVFPKRTEFTGYFCLKLWVEAVGNDDIDLFAKFSKRDSKGNLVETTCIDVGYLQDDPEMERKKLIEMHHAGDKHVDVFFAEGSTGRLRVSRRELDEDKSTPHQPVYTHGREQKLRPGEMVPVEIEMWPHGMIWEAGEQITVSIAGFNLRPEVTWMTPAVKTLNKGNIVIHTGGIFNSHLLVPFIPS
ncbi:hydrolase CocE/NonD family protein [Stipitochalara longipes BDJ]|nr:hydrolase CocE/NonD family protein [Stipitochalara longipes BDJ]